MFADADALLPPEVPEPWLVWFDPKSRLWYCSNPLTGLVTWDCPKAGVQGDKAKGGRRTRRDTPPQQAEEEGASLEARQMLRKQPAPPPLLLV